MHSRLPRIICTLFSILLLLPFASHGETTPPLVLFDQGHAQRFVIEEQGELQLSGLAAIMTAQGARVAAQRKVLSDEALKGASALVISGPFSALGDDEADAVVRFINRGGRLAVMLHVGPPLAGLLGRLDVDHSNAVLHERTDIIEQDINFRVSDLSPDPLFTGISHFSAYGAWGLMAGAGSASLARTSPEAWFDLNHDGKLSKGDVTGAFTVVVSGTRGAGRFIVFGDDAIFQNRFLDESNARLARNLAAWLIAR